MIKLLSRKPRKRHNALATIIERWDTDSATFVAHKLPRADAEMLHEAGKLQMLDLGKGYDGLHFGPPRSFRQMLHNEWPKHHPDVLALIAKQENAT